MSDALLDAARDVFEQYGARRANMDDIATAAGISRSTLYRAYPTKEQLLVAVIVRETDAFFDDLESVAQNLPPQDAVAECFTRGLSILNTIPVLARLAQTEPEVITGMPGRRHMLLAHSDRVARTLRRAGAEMPDRDLQMAAELLFRLASTYVMDPEGHLDLDDEDAVRALAKQYLAPLVH